MSDDNHKPVVIGGLELDYPERKNCFSEAMYTQCIDALVQFEVDPEIVCVIITGAGDIFSSGADLKEGIADYDVVQRFMVKVITYSKILVAAVNGPAIGIGVTLLPHCDLVFASEQATFWTPFSRIAVVPEFCSSFLFPQIMGRAKANNLLLRAAVLTAHEAMEYNLISAVYPQYQFLDHVKSAVIETLKFPLASKSMLLFKKMMRSRDCDQLVKICNEELELLQERIQNGDVAIAVTCLLQQKYQGKLQSKL